ncbi:MAG: hypothetical protein KF745_01990 [Phycisphaeraceae bacterium]|nr:hypothetical protein [Phycisphaeraceae bacterium]
MNGTVSALTVLPGGDLVAAGSFTTAGGITVNRIARWNGAAWSALGTGMDDLVNAVTTLSNGDLVAGGRFTTAGGAAASRIARWDGTAWSAVGGGVGGTPPYYVVSLKTLANGDLIAGGYFSTAGGVPASSIARWDGSAWAPLGVGISGVVNALTTMSNGDLIVGGQFTNTGNLGLVVRRIARWNGTAWSAIGTGMDGAGFPLVWSVWTLPQGDLVAAGDFSSAGGNVANNVARWNGTAWSALGSGTNNVVRALTTLNDSTLVAAGNFSLAGGATANRVARYATGFTGPHILQHPQDSIACPDHSVEFHVSANGLSPFTYQWQWQPAGTATAWVDLAVGDNADTGGVLVVNVTNEATATLEARPLAGYTNFAPREFRCVVTNACGDSVTSDAATLTVCPADFDCDGQITPLDIAAFVNAWSTSLATGTLAGDFDSDGAVTPTDIAVFVSAWFSAVSNGC